MPVSVEQVFFRGKNQGFEMKDQGQNAKKLVTKELTKRFVKLSLYQLLMISHLAQKFQKNIH